MNETEVLKALQALLPILIISSIALLILIIEAFIPPEQDENRTISFFISIGGMIISLGYLIYQLTYDVGVGSYFGGSIKVDHFGLAFSIIICIGTLMVIMASHHYLIRIKSNLGEFNSLILFATAGMIMVTMSNDMMTFFISFEIMSVALFILAGFQTKYLKSNESAMKYFILGSFSTAFMLLGIAFIYGATGELAFDQIAAVLDKIAAAKTDDYYLGLFGLALVLGGFLFKLGAFPFHQWVPDVYEGAPTSVTAFMATGVKTAAFAITVRILFVIFKAEDYSSNWVDVLMAVSVLTMVAGNFMALVQTNIKRLLAYSGIAHTGYILLAIIAAKVSQGKTDSIDTHAILFYLLVYTIMTIGAFAALIGTGKRGLDLETLDDIKGFAYKNPLVAMTMAVFFFSLAGIPSTAGFMGKLFIFKAVISAKLYTLAVIGIITAIVSVYYYLRVVVSLYYIKDETATFPAHRTRWNYMLVAFVAFMLIILLGFFPQLGFYLLRI